MITRVTQVKYKKSQLRIMGVTSDGFVKIAKLRQGSDGSLYVMFKNYGIPSHYSWHPDGRRKITHGNKGEIEPIWDKVQPIEEIEFSQHIFFSTGDVLKIPNFYDVTDKIALSDNLLVLDLRDCEQFGVSVYYSKPENLANLRKAMEFQKATDVYISAKTIPCSIVMVTKTTKKNDFIATK